MEIITVDNTDLVKGELEAAILRGLEKCGLVAEGYAKKLCPVAPVNGGNLRNSITHKVKSKSNEVYIGTNVEYAAYVELGTGRYYPGGRQTPWAYTDDEGNTHWTRGQRPQPYLKPAATEHKDVYRDLIESELKG